MNLYASSVKDKILNNLDSFKALTIPITLNAFLVILLLTGISNLDNFNDYSDYAFIEFSFNILKISGLAAIFIYILLELYLFGVHNIYINKVKDKKLERIQERTGRMQMKYNQLEKLEGGI